MLRLLVVTLGFFSTHYATIATLGQTKNCVRRGYKKGTDFWILPWLLFCCACCNSTKAIEPALSGSQPVQQESGLHGTTTVPKESFSRGQWLGDLSQELWGRCIILGCSTTGYGDAGVLLGEGAVTGHQSLLSKHNGCCWKDLRSHFPSWFSMLKLDIQKNLGWLGLLELLIFDGNWIKLKDVKIGGLSDGRWIWESSWCFPESPVCLASMQEDKSMMVFPVDCHTKAPKAKTGLVAVNRSIPVKPPSFICSEALNEQCAGTRVVICQKGAAELNFFFHISPRC